MSLLMCFLHLVLCKFSFSRFYLVPGLQHHFFRFRRARDWGGRLWVVTHSMKSSRDAENPYERLGTGSHGILHFLFTTHNLQVDSKFKF